jgi:HD-GYP domain-containing protein (c-di-GMP phosphodiesterase class II)
MGLPMEHVLRQSLLALGLAELLGLEEADQEAVYFGSLIVWVGCHVDAYEQAKWFGDETVLRGDFRKTDFHHLWSRPEFGLRHLGGNVSLGERAALLPRFLTVGRRDFQPMLENHWRASDDLMSQIGFDQAIRDTVEQTFERWDGRGVPKGLQGSEILLTSRLINLADVVEFYHRTSGAAAAVEVARERAGTQFDPDVVDTFVGASSELLGDLEHGSAWDAVVAAPPASRYWLSGVTLDTALLAVADFCDVKSPYTIGHSRGVAALAADASSFYGLDELDMTMLRRAALLHDLGNLGIPNELWDKRGVLSPVELERARLHVHLTERMLASSTSLKPLAAIAAQHHERLDGSGYPRGLVGADLTATGRLLAAADVYHAMQEPRPHRDAFTSAEAAAHVESEVRAGRLDADAVRAVLTTKGQRVSKRRTWPAGLTSREVEVLRLLARGRTNRQIANELAISPKTASSHVEHIYVKLGVSTRALASLFAAKHGLIELEDV